MNDYDTGKLTESFDLLFGIKFSVTDIVDCGSGTDHIKYSEVLPELGCLPNESCTRTINSQLFLSKPSPLKKRGHQN